MRNLLFPSLLVSGLFSLCLLCPLSGSASDSKVEKPEPPAAVDHWGDGKVRLIIRTDDVGFCHAANVAFEKIAREGVISAVSVIVNTPWLDEAVQMLKRHPEVSVGVHTCFNSEWKLYRWGPVSPVSEVPSLVDQWGKFFGMKKEFVDNQPDLDEFEKELRAQVDLALKKGLRISYMDHHMGTAAHTPELKERFVRVAKDYGLGISRWFGETSRVNIYSVTPEDKADSLIEQIRAIDTPGLHLVVSHPGLNTPEMAAMKDVHPWAPQNMSEHREAETMALCDPRLKRLLKEKQIEVVGYDVMREKFLERMRDPQKDFYKPKP